ncbi:MAG: acyclic terpene utilization AtuA family protein [Pseudorhodoferax sp.]
MNAAKEIRILTPVGMLGYGIPEDDFMRGIAAGADAVVVDAGSTDPGPYQLGLAKTIVSASALERDLRTILKGCRVRGIPLLIGSAGGPGIGQHVDETIAILGRIAAEGGYRLKVAAIYADVDKELVRQRFQAGQISSCASAPQATLDDVETSEHIVAQMGSEPILQVLRAHPDVDVVVAGRAYDPAPYAAFCQLHGIEDPGIYWHMGKIMECGANCAEPKGKVILATIRQDSFDLEPMSPGERCTPLSVAAHTLYEKTRPDLLSGPGACWT